MEFYEIEAERKARRISQYRLCHVANVHPTTYQRLLKAPDSGQRRTISKLGRALREIPSREDAAE